MKPPTVDQALMEIMTEVEQRWYRRVRHGRILVVIERDYGETIGHSISASRFTSDDLAGLMRMPPRRERGRRMTTGEDSHGAPAGRPDHWRPDV